MNKNSINIIESEQLRGARIASYLIPFITFEMSYFIYIKEYSYHGGAIFTGIPAIIVSIITLGFFFTIFIIMHKLAFKEYGVKLPIYKIIVLFLINPFFYILILSTIIYIYTRIHDVEHDMLIFFALILLCFIFHRIYNWSFFRLLRNKVTVINR